MSIVEDNNVNEATYPYIFPDTDLKIQSVFRRRNKTVIPCNIAMLTKTPRDQSWTDIPSSTTAKAMPEGTGEANTFKTAAEHFMGIGGAGFALDTKPNATSTFTMNASENQLFRLQDAEINMIAQYAYYDEAEDVKSSLPITKPMFGNQCLLSLFQMIELRIDGQPIERNAYPGFSSNMDYALKYPHCKSLEKDYEIHGFVSTDPKKYVLPQPGTNQYEGVRTAFDSFKQEGITCQCISLPRSTSDGLVKSVSNTYTAAARNFYTGFINQRYKLSDLFSCVRDMPTIFNHKIEVVLQRTSTNDIICNTFTCNNVKAKFLGFWTYNLIQYVSETTNELSDYARAYYSRPIETMITVKKDVITPLIQKPTPSGTMSFNIGVDPSFKNCLLTIAIPRTNDLSGQFNSNKAFFTHAGKVYTATLGVDNSTANRHYDTFYAPCNSYTSGGLKYLTVYNNGTILYNFTMEDDGTMFGPSGNFRVDKPNTQNNYAVGSVKCANYQDVYIQYIRAREHFEEPECEALDYNTFMKEYCVFCIDLSCFEINANQQLTIVLGFSSWDSTYSPYYTSNATGNISNDGGDVVKSEYVSTQIISNLYCKKILRLLPGRNVGLYDALTTTTAEVEAKISV